MSAQKGKDMLLKIDSDGLGAYTTVAGLRAKTLSFNTDTIDITNADSQDQWRELLAGGVKTARITGSGIFKDQPSDELVRSYYFNTIIRNWQITIPDFGLIEGAFQISGFEYAGGYNNEMSFELTLDSAGPLSFAVI